MQSKRKICVRGYRANTVLSYSCLEDGIEEKQSEIHVREWRNLNFRFICLGFGGHLISFANFFYFLNKDGHDNELSFITVSLVMVGRKG